MVVRLCVFFFLWFSFSSSDVHLHIASVCIASMYAVMANAATSTSTATLVVSVYVQLVAKAVRFHFLIIRTSTSYHVPDTHTHTRRTVVGGYAQANEREDARTHIYMADWVFRHCWRTKRVHTVCTFWRIVTYSRPEIPSFSLYRMALLLANLVLFNTFNISWTACASLLLYFFIPYKCHWRSSAFIFLLFNGFGSVSL